MCYDKSYTELTIALLDGEPTLENIRRHKASVKKWLKGSVKNPTKFGKKYANCPIAKITFKDGTPLFPFKAFDNWSYGVFVEQYQRYQKDKNSQHISLQDYRYIYYYHEDIKKLAYFEIKYYENGEIELVTHHHPQVIRYIGNIKHHYESSMIHFIVENESEKMFFSFNELDLKLNFNVYGVAISKDYSLKHPKSSLVLLSNDKLTLPKEKLFRTKINSCNITIANNEKKSEEISFLDNLSIQLRALKDNQENYHSKNIFLRLFMGEFSLFYRKFDKFLNQNQFKLNSFSTSINCIFSLLDEIGEKERIKIIYTLKDIKKSLFSLVDSEAKMMYDYFIQLSLSGQFDIEFIIILEKQITIDNQLKEQFERLQKSGIELLFRDNSNLLAYSTIALIDNYDLFAIFALKSDKEYTVTRYQTDVKNLKTEYETQKSYAISLNEMLKKQLTLQGKYYFYGYGAKHTLHRTTVFIDGKSVILKLYNREYRGEIYNLYGNIVICSELGIMKLKERYKHRAIKTVSFISEQHHGNGESIILFGVLSRYLLEEEELKSIFSTLVDKKESPRNKASFKESASVHDKIIKPLLFKYEGLK